MSHLDDVASEINSMATNIAELRKKSETLVNQIERLKMNLTSLPSQYDENGNDKNAAVRAGIQSKIRELESMQLQLDNYIYSQQSMTMEVASSYKSQTHNAQRMSNNTLEAKKAVFDKIANGKFGKTVASSYSNVAVQRSQSYSDEIRVYSSLADAASAASDGIRTENIDTTIADRGSFEFKNGRVTIGDTNGLLGRVDFKLNQKAPFYNMETNSNNDYQLSGFNNKDVYLSNLKGNISNSISEVLSEKNGIALEELSSSPIINKSHILSSVALDRKYGDMYEIAPQQMNELMEENGLVFAKNRNLDVGIISRSMDESALSGQEIKIISDFDGDGISYVNLVRNYGAEWSSSISLKEREAVNLYTGTAYSNINAVERGIEKKYIDNNFEVARNLHSALQKAEIPCDCVTYRGCSSKALGLMGRLSDEQLIGKVFRDKGFMSTSLDRGNAFSNDDMLLIINVPKGAKGAYVGYLSAAKHYETEVLFDINQMMKIDHVDRDELGRRIVTVTLF